MQPKITLQEMRKSVRYNPDTGHFTRLNGKRAGAVHKNGYRAVQLGGRSGVLFYEHRLAHVYMTGEWPVMEIDHINGDRADNRWSNLRPATKSQNMMNAKLPKHNTSGTKGVSYDSARNLWMAYIQHNKKVTRLGRFSDKKSAVAARRAAEPRFHGDFAWVGGAQ